MAKDVHHPVRLQGLSVRVQLTLSYAAFVIIVGIVLFALGFLLLRFVPESNPIRFENGFIVSDPMVGPNRSSLQDIFVRYALWALVLLAALGLGGGWLLAGRMLKPLTRITDAARRARDGSLDHRIHMPGRLNELAELADVFDDMLTRVQRTVEEQRRFAANASHELRTPHTAIRTMLEVAQADPAGRDVDTVLRRVEEMNERSILLTESLLNLAHSEHHSQELMAVDLAAIVSTVVDELRDDATRAQIRISTRLAVRRVRGDRTLLTQLVINLVQNAILHNHAAGQIEVTTHRTPAGATELLVSNTGALLDESTLETLTEPFVRGAGRTRHNHDRHVGSGLGLAIVASIVRVHAGTVHLSARADGGLQVRVTFPPVSD